MSGPRRNRVTPDGELIAVPDRGLLWGNRGCLHDRDATIVRYSRGRAWLICVLEFKGRRRQLMAPGRLTELFFLDEATGLAAGHRPCGECRTAEYRAFKSAWAAGHPGEEASAGAIDTELHASRLVGPGMRRRHNAQLDALPDGAMVEVEGAPWLVWDSQLLAWTPGGYHRRRPRPRAVEVTVITPRPTVEVLARGYCPLVHGTAGSTFGAAPGGDG